MPSLKRLLQFHWPRNDGLCAPRTEEFEEWLESIPSSSDIYCESESMYVNPTDTGAADPGGCLVTVATTRSATGRSLRDREGDIEGMAARLEARGGAAVGMGPPATLAVSCGEGGRRH